MCSTSKLSRVQRVRLQRLYSLSLLSHQLNFKQGRFIVNGDFCNFFVSHSAVSKQVDILECHFSEVIRSKMRRQKKVKVLLVNEWKSCCKSSKHLLKSQQAKAAFNVFSDPAVPQFDCDEGNLFQARAWCLNAPLTKCFAKTISLSGVLVKWWFMLGWSHHRVFQPQVKTGHCRSDSICVLLVVDSVHVCIAQATAWLQRKRSWEGDGVNDRREKAWMWSTCLVTLYDLRNKSRLLETLVIAVIREHNDRKVRE